MSPLSIPYAVPRAAAFRVEPADAGGYRVVQVEDEILGRGRAIWRFFPRAEREAAEAYARLLEDAARGRVAAA